MPSYKFISYNICNVTNYNVIKQKEFVNLLLLIFPQKNVQISNGFKVIYKTSKAIFYLY